MNPINYFRHKTSFGYRNCARIHCMEPANLRPAVTSVASCSTSRRLAYHCSATCNGVPTRIAAKLPPGQVGEGRKALFNHKWWFRSPAPVRRPVPEGRTEVASKPQTRLRVCRSYDCARYLFVSKSKCFYEFCEINCALRLCLPHGRPSTAWLPGPLIFIHILGVP